MEPMVEYESELDLRTDEDTIVHAWRAEQLRRLGLPGMLAEAVADDVDWREVADLVRRGCPAELALEIVR